MPVLGIAALTQEDRIRTLEALAKVPSPR
jgi:hypothetical protein